MLEAEGLTEELQAKWALLPVGLRRQVLDFVEFLVKRYVSYAPRGEAKTGSEAEGLVGSGGLSVEGLTGMACRVAELPELGDGFDVGDLSYDEFGLPC